MTYWKVQINYNPCVNWRPWIYFAISAPIANHTNVKTFIENLTEKEVCSTPKKINLFEYLCALMTRPVTNHRDYRNFKKSVVIE